MSFLNGGKTGYPPGLLQDDCRKLSKWFASRIDARKVIRMNLMKCLPDVIDHNCRNCQRLTDTASEGVVHMIGSFDNACAYLPKSASCKEVQAQSAQEKQNEHQ